MQYRKEIDGLRALAVLPVIFFHAGVQAFSGGFVGVDIFFVISGYLITTLILIEKEAQTFTLFRFYERRARRILPALLVMMLACIPLAWHLASPTDMKSFHKALAAATFFSSNIFFSRGGGYFDPATDDNPLLHTWSLGVEEQYYLLFPLALGLLSSWSGKNKIKLLGVLSALSLIAAHLGASTDPISTFYLLPTRAWELFIGVFAAAYLHHNTNQLNRFSVALKQSLSLVGASLIVFSIVAFDKKTPFPSLYALLPTMGAALIIVFGTSQTWVGRMLSMPLLVGIGLISYSAYLWHQPIFVFSRHINGNSFNNNWLTVLVGLTFILAFFSWKYIETPFRKNKFSPKVTLTVLCLSIFGVVLFGILSKLSNGYANRFPMLQKYAAETAWPESFNLNPVCANKYGGDQYCQINNINTLVTDALIGDSHANHFYFGLAEYLKGKGRNLIQQGAGGCPPFLGADLGKHPVHGLLKCHEKTNSLYNAILKNPNIQNVYLAFHHSYIFDVDIPIFDVNGEIDSAADRELFLQAALLRTVQTFELAGKKVILLYDLPNLNKDEPTKCLMKSNVTHSADYCRRTLVFDREFAQYDRLLNFVKERTRLQVFDTRTYLTNFPISDQGVWMYRDSTHLSVNGSMYFADKYSF